jgi:hypothetical protein
MRCLCFKTVDVPSWLMRLLGGLLVLCLTVAVSMQAGAAERNCALGEPTVSEKGKKITLQIKLACGDAPTGATMATNKNYLIGLTLYALAPRSGGDEGVDGFLEKAAPGVAQFSVDGGDLEIVQKPRPTGKIERRIITDDRYLGTSKPYDLPVQQLRISASAKAVTFDFTADKEKIAGYNHLLFAVWPASEKRACKRDGDRPRSGCTAYGYVIGDEGGVNPVDYYPGMATFNSDTVQGLTQWIVEKFR